MKKSLLFVFIMTFLILVSCEYHNKNNDSFKIIINEKTKKLDLLYSELYNNQKFNGNVLVAEKGDIIFQKSFGLANEKDQIKLNLETTFELASVSKQFTAMGIILLEKEGKLSLTDTISKYIPELKEYKAITIQNLLTHTSGLPDYMELSNNELDKSKIATNQDIINLFHKVKPKRNFESNQKWEYSNTGYLLLATIIERVSKKEYGDYLKEKIFDPLKMKNTFVHRRRFNPKEINNYALGYIYSDSLKKKILPDELGKEYYVVYLDGIVGDGMVNSNLYDLLKWDRALYNNVLVTEEEKKHIFSSYKINGNTETDYGYGWMIEDSEKFNKIVSHSGGWAGYITYIERHIDNDKTIIILQNNSTNQIEIPIKNTRRILYGMPIEKPIKLVKEVLGNLAGIYISNKGIEEQIIFENDKLWVPMNPEINLELVPVSETKFIVDGFSPEVSYTFVLNKKGEVKQCRIQQEGTKVDKVIKRKKN
ncbi:serine hydrolase domain-containing protein [Tenacibaculum sp. ZS6-P6]|uniref:serine hydrolase domain-containing protein n=1 Tax=Tenacibaculum sp. ZS6-P6 TaxID=3447503 RepID=UPI003F95B9FF